MPDHLNRDNLSKYFIRPEFKVNIDRSISSKLAMIFWFKNKSRESFLSIFNQIKNIVS